VTRTLLAFLVAAVLCGCAAPASPQPTPDIASPVDGIVVAVDASGLTNVRGFTLRASSGSAFGFTLGPLENATQFPPAHLAEHMASSSPVRVYFRVENGERVAYRLEDAPAPVAS
jgi:hypothetical protein